MGFEEHHLKWFESYLSDREKFVNYNGYSSSHKKVKCESHKAQLPGPLLFLIYINDLSSVSKALDFILFADDTNIFFSHSNLESISLIVNSELNTLTDWFRANKHLTWLPHINDVTRKISKSIGIIYKASFCLPQQALKTLYYSLIYPYIQFCVSVWGSTYPTNLNCLILLQKKVVRIIAMKPHDVHTDPIFKDIENLKFKSRISFSC